MSWSRAHWAVGVLTLLIFLLTVAYLRHKAAVPDLEPVPRLVFRSRHLFVMLAAVANLSLSSSRPVSLAQRVASLLILISPLLLLGAFFIDPARGLKSSQVFHFCMYGLFAAGVLLAITNRPWRKEKARREC